MLTKLPLELEDVAKPVVIPDNVLSWRGKFQAGKHFWEWLIQSKEMFAEDATSEEEILLRSQFPFFSLVWLPHTFPNII